MYLWNGSGLGYIAAELLARLRVTTKDTSRKAGLRSEL